MMKSMAKVLEILEEFPRISDNMHFIHKFT